MLYMFLYTSNINSTSTSSMMVRMSTTIFTKVMNLHRNKGSGAFVTILKASRPILNRHNGYLLRSKDLMRTLNCTPVRFMASKLVRSVTGSVLSQ